VLIELNSISPTYLGEAHLASSEVWGRSLSLQGPEGILFWGASGRGKSSLLRMLYGLESRFAGELRIDGKLIASPAHRFWPALRSRHLAFVPQEFQLLEDDSGWENLRILPSTASGVGTPLLLDWSRELGIDAILERPPSTWSHGQKQRFAVLRALASPFQWILLDEPTSHLDPDSAHKCLNLIFRTCLEREAGWILTQQTAANSFGANHILGV